MVTEGDRECKGHYLPLQEFEAVSALPSFEPVSDSHCQHAKVASASIYSVLVDTEKSSHSNKLAKITKKKKSHLFTEPVSYTHLTLPTKVNV